MKPSGSLSMARRALRLLADIDARVGSPGLARSEQTAQEGRVFFAPSGAAPRGGSGNVKPQARRSAPPDLTMLRAGPNGEAPYTRRSARTSSPLLREPSSLVSPVHRAQSMLRRLISVAKSASHRTDVLDPHVLDSFGAPPGARSNLHRGQSVGHDARYSPVSPRPVPERGTCARH